MTTTTTAAAATTTALQETVAYHLSLGLDPRDTAFLAWATPRQGTPPETFQGFSIE